MHLSSLLAVAGLGASVADAYFMLRSPRTLGYRMENAQIGPCGGFSLTGTHTGTNYPVKGFPFAVTSTYAGATFTVKVRLMDDPADKLQDIMPPLYMSQYGTLCIPSVEVKSEWAGQLAEYHVISDHPNMRTFQCAIVQFVDAPKVDPLTVDVCKNTTGVNGTFQSWGSQVTTLPTPHSETSASATATAVDRSPASKITAAIGPWLVVILPVLTGALPFLASFS